MLHLELLNKHPLSGHSLPTQGPPHGKDKRAAAPCLHLPLSLLVSEKKLNIPVIRRLGGDKVKAVFIATPVYCTHAARLAVYFSSVLKASHTGRMLYPPLSAYCIDSAPGPLAPTPHSLLSFTRILFFLSSVPLC